MWQVCPLCKGSGVTPHSYSTQTSMQCTVCKSKKIINELTGHPPADFIPTNPTKSNDFYKQLTDTNDPLKNVNFL